MALGDVTADPSLQTAGELAHSAAEHLNQEGLHQIGQTGFNALGRDGIKVGCDALFSKSQRYRVYELICIFNPSHTMAY